MNYAIIENGVVGNVIILRPANAKDFPGAVALHDRPVTIGDNYINGKFYRDGNEVLTELEIAQKEIDSLTQSLGEAVETIYQSDMNSIG